MTTIISRLYADPDTANAAKDALLAKGASPANLSVTDATEDALKAVDAPATVTAAFSKVGGTALIYRAPFGAAKPATGVLADYPGVDVGPVNDAAYAPTGASNSILKSHPYMMSNPHGKLMDGLILSGTGVSSKPRKNSVISGGMRIIPFPTLKAKGRATSAISGGMKILSRG